MILWLSASVLQILALVFSNDDDYYYSSDDGSFGGCKKPPYDPSSWDGYSYGDDGYGGRTYNYTTGTYDYESGTTNVTEYKIWYDDAVKQQKAACGRGIAEIVFVLLVLWVFTSTPGRG
jgi:hypothetical protein